MEKRKGGRPARPDARREFHCTECDRSFTANFVLKEHVKVHTGVRPFSCTETGCYKTFTTSCNLKRHVVSVHGQGDFACSWFDCGMRFRTEDQKRKHYAIEHGPKNIMRRAFICPVKGCPRAYMSRGNLTRHLRVNHENRKSVVKLKKTYEANLLLLAHASVNNDQNKTQNYTATS